MSAKLVLKELSRYKIGTLANIIYRNALLYPKKEAFICSSERITFAEFNSRVNILVHALHSMGVNKGDVIGILSWNCLECYEVLGAAQKGGFILSPFNVRLHPDNLKYLIAHSEANTLFLGPEFVEMAKSLRRGLPKLKNLVSFEESTAAVINYGDLLAGYPSREPDVEVEEDDPLYIVYTAGTTGIPRGALWTHGRWIEHTRGVITGLSLEPTDKLLFPMPFFHVGGVGHPLDYFYVGGTSVIMKAFEPVAALQIIQDEKVTGMILVPTQLIAMLSSHVNKYDLSSLKRVVYVGSAMPLEVLERAIRQLGPIFVGMYALTESGRNLTFLRKEEHKLTDKPENRKILTSAGRQHMEVHIRIVDDEGNDVPPGELGEIIVQSKGMMVEYWRNPDRTRERIVNGWLHTGDVGQYDENGYIYIVDRKDDMIISGGENIFPREVEEVLYKHPSVQEAAVIGVPDPYWVERVHAVVTLREGARLTANELITFCRNHIARYKAPKSVEFVDSMPHTPVGKISRKQLKEQYLKGLEKLS